jgi:hypothetical protein
MPATLTLDELDKLAGIDDAMPTFNAAKKTQLSMSELDRLIGVGEPEKPPEETDGFISSIIKNAFAETTYGIAARATGLVDYEPKDLGTVGNIASSIGGFIADAPVLALTGGLGGIIGKQAAKKLVAYAAKKGLIGAAAKAVPPAIHAGVQLGGLEAAREVAGGEFHPGEITKQTLAGAAFGPAGLVKNPIARLVAEVASMATVPALLELRAPTSEDWINAGGTVGGFKLYHGLSKLAKLAYRKSVSRKDYVDATGVKPNEVLPEKDRKEAADAALAAELKAVTDKEIVNAAQVWQVQIGDTGKRQGVDPLRAEAEAGRGDRPVESGEVPQAERNVLDAETKTTEAVAAEAAEKVSETQGEVGDVLRPAPAPAAQKPQTFKEFAESRGRWPIKTSDSDYKSLVSEYTVSQVSKPAARAEAIRMLNEAGAEIPSESAPPDVKGQGALGEVESPKVQAARAKLEASEQELAKHRKGPALFTGGIDFRDVALAAKVFKAELGLGWAKFSDYVASLGRRFGAAVVRAHSALIRDTWEAERKNNPKLDAAGDVEAILAKEGIADAPEATTPRPMRDKGRLPELAIPVTEPAARDMLRGVDELRTAADEPRRVTHVEANAIANQRIAERGAEYRDRLVAESWTPVDAPDTRVQIKVITELGKRVADDPNDVAAWEALSRGDFHYRVGGTAGAQALEARKALMEMPEPERNAFMAQRALAQPPEQIERAIKKAEAREAKERQRQPKPHPLTPEEIRVEGMLPAPPGTKLPPKPPVQGPESQKRYESRVRKAKEQVEKLHREWAEQIKRYSGELTKLGHDVEKALRGELDPLATKAFLRDAYAVKSSVPDVLYEWWRESILSGPATETTNMLGGAVHGAWYFSVDRFTDAFVSSIARGLGYKPDGAYFGEFKHIARAFMRSSGKANQNFMETWRTELPQFYLTHGLEAQAAAPHEFTRAAIAGKKGWWIRRSSGLMTAVDDYIKTRVAAMEQASLAYRQGKSEGLSGKDLDARMTELMNDPLSEPSQKAVDTAIRLALQEKTPALEAGLSLRREIPGLRYLLPFMTTPFNIFKAGIRRSPFGSIKLGTELLRASRDGDYSHISQRVAEQVLAWGATLALAYTNDPANPWITGGEDKNRPYSIKIGSQWYSYGRIEPAATMVGLVVDGIGKIHQGADWFEALKAPFDALAGRVENQTFFAGISDFMKAARYQKSEYVLDWATKFPASWVPNLVRAPARAATENKPERRVWDKGMARADRSLRRGIASLEVVPEYPKYDLWGRAVPRDGGPLPGTDWIFRTLSPVGRKKYVETIGDRLLTKWNASHPDDKAVFKPPNPYFTEKGKVSYFTDDENATYVRESGRLTQQRVIAAQARGALNMNDPGPKDIERLDKIIETSRERIRNALKRARRKAEQSAA